MTSSNILDLVFLFLFLTFCIRGAFKGLSGEIFSILGTIGGIFLAWRFTKPVSEIILSRSDFHPAVVFVTILVLLYVVAVILAALLCKAVKAFIRFTQLSFLDRVLGVAAGVLKTLVLVIFLYLVTGSFSSFIPSEWFSESVTLKIGAYIWPTVESLLVQFNLVDPQSLLPGTEGSL
jgi:membrane protein required for colicin V production